MKESNSSLIINLSLESEVFELLQKVFQNKAYSSIELDRALSERREKDGAAYITKLFYGVLDKSVQFDYIINKLCEKSPKSSIKILLKMGLYLLRYMETPSYAAVNKIVELTKTLGKSGVSGFVNAVLKKSEMIELPQNNSELGLSVNASAPLWLVSLICKQYTFDFAKSFFMCNLITDTHIRANKFNITESQFFEKYSDLLNNKSELGYYVTHNTLNLLSKKDFAIQSLASMLAVKAYFDKTSEKILDLCAAPGGKSIYLLEQYLDVNEKLPLMTACDIHLHRVELIKKYAKNIGCDLEIMFNDATVLNDYFIDKFDMVICDAPCSGIGVISSKPEILLNRTLEDIESLTNLQLKILETATNYVKVGGCLCYSTCTILKNENEYLINGFLKNHNEFVLQNISNEFVKSKDDGYVKLFPQVDNCDGFFVAKLLKIK